MKLKGLLKAVWQFCSYLFVPQWGRKSDTNHLRVIYVYSRSVADIRIIFVNNVS